MMVIEIYSHYICLHLTSRTLTQSRNWIRSSSRFHPGLFLCSSGCSVSEDSAVLPSHLLPNLSQTLRLLKDHTLKVNTLIMSEMLLLPISSRSSILSTIRFPLTGSIWKFVPYLAGNTKQRQHVYFLSNTHFWVFSSNTWSEREANIVTFPDAVSDRLVDTRVSILSLYLFWHDGPERTELKYQPTNDNMRWTRHIMCFSMKNILFQTCLRDSPDSRG